MSSSRQSSVGTEKTGSSSRPAKTPSAYCACVPTLPMFPPTIAISRTSKLIRCIRYAWEGGTHSSSDRWRLLSLDTRVLLLNTDRKGTGRTNQQDRASCADGFMANVLQGSCPPPAPRALPSGAPCLPGESVPVPLDGCFVLADKPYLRVGFPVPHGYPAGDAA